MWMHMSIRNPFLCAPGRAGGGGQQLKNYSFKWQHILGLCGYYEIYGFLGGQIYIDWLYPAKSTDFFVLG